MAYNSDATIYALTAYPDFGAPGSGLAADALDADGTGRGATGIADALDRNHRMKRRKMAVGRITGHRRPYLQDDVPHVVVAVVYLPDELSLPAIEVLVF